MHGKSLQEGSAVMINHRTEFLRCALLWWACLMAPSLTLARMTDVTLMELVKKSDVIVFGHVSSTVDSATSAPVRFEVISVIKGGGTLKAGKILLLCNPHSNSELPDLSKLSGDNVIFLSKATDCFDLSHGYVSVVQVADGRASTYAIKDQPKSRQWKPFLRQLQATVASQ